MAGNIGTYIQRSDGLLPEVLPTIRQTEINFGVTPLIGQSFTITDPDVRPGMVITAVQSADAATSKSSDENEMDMLLCRATAGAGTFTLYADALSGPVVGAFKVNYTFR